jgi:hypothetical protein
MGPVHTDLLAVLDEIKQQVQVCPLNVPPERICHHQESRRRRATCV